jgi:hypothetical protein
MLRSKCSNTSSTSRAKAAATGSHLIDCSQLARLSVWRAQYFVLSIQRDEPVHLSGFRLRTHQHFSPADANCCQSLLLDPDATIGIDLHKRLFLLVSGRGESTRVFPYHGCALPTELGGRVLFLQLGTNIAAVMLIEGPAHQALIRRQRR